MKRILLYLAFSVLGISSATHVLASPDASENKYIYVYFAGDQDSEKPGASSKDIKSFSFTITGGGLDCLTISMKVYRGNYCEGGSYIGRYLGDMKFSQSENAYVIRMRRQNLYLYPESLGTSPLSFRALYEPVDKDGNPDSDKSLDFSWGFNKPQKP